MVDRCKKKSFIYKYLAFVDNRAHAHIHTRIHPYKPFSKSFKNEQSTHLTNLTFSKKILTFPSTALPSYLKSNIKLSSQLIKKTLPRRPLLFGKASVTSAPSPKACCSMFAHFTNYRLKVSCKGWRGGVGWWTESHFGYLLPSPPGW